MFGGKFGTGEMLLLLLVLILLFGARKLPDTARGLGRSLRIFKAETKGLRDDDDPEAEPYGDRTAERARTDRVNPDHPRAIERSGFDEPSATSAPRERRADEV
jgi:sec-independent protein translocase protein TatA